MTKRIEELDIIRGYALFGILICNMILFGYPSEYFSEYYSIHTGWINDFSKYIRFNFFSDRTFTIFSFLFGLGIGMQYHKFLNSGKSFNKHHLIRMVILFFIGLLHGLFIWYGDILTLYALLGVLTLPFIRFSTKSLLLIGLFIFFYPLLQAILQKLGYFAISPQSNDSGSLQELIALNIDNGFIGHLKYNFSQLSYTLHYYISGFAYYSFSMILIGIGISKLNWQNTINKDLNKYKQILLVSGIIVLLWNLFKIFYFEKEGLSRLSYFTIYLGLYYLSMIGQTFLVISLLILVFNSKRKVFRRIRVFGYLGRMSLTNYVLHSILGIIIFKIFRLYGESSPFMDMILAIIIVVFQIFMSKWIIEKYRTGPIEQLWRKATIRLGTKVRPITRGHSQ